MARQSCSCVSGNSSSGSPKGESASAAAFSNAAGTPMQPASPTPLVPSVFVVDGEGVISDSFELIFTPEEIEAAIAKVS